MLSIAQAAPQHRHSSVIDQCRVAALVTFPRTASAKATKSKDKCTCPKFNLGIKATDLITVSSIGNYIQNTAQIQSATLDATSQTYLLTHVSKKFWKLQLDGVFKTVLVTVDNKKVFTCESTQFAVASSFCSNLNIDLQKIRGSLQLFAKRFDSKKTSYQIMWNCMCSRNVKLRLKMFSHG